MDRRSFLLGTLASGVAFYTQELIPQTPKNLQGRLRRLYSAGYNILQNCQLALKNKEGLWTMPGMAQVRRISADKISFKAHDLTILHVDVWTGGSLIDDEDFTICNFDFDKGPVHTVCGDVLRVSHELNIGVK